MFQDHSPRQMKEQTGRAELPEKGMTLFPDVSFRFFSSARSLEDIRGGSVRKRQKGAAASGERGAIGTVGALKVDKYLNRFAHLTVAPRNGWSDRIP
jgi:hypothetical protein